MSEFMPFGNPNFPIELKGKDDIGDFFELRFPRGMSVDELEAYKEKWAKEQERLHGAPTDLGWVYRRPPPDYGDYRFYLPQPPKFVGM